MTTRHHSAADARTDQPTFLDFAKYKSSGDGLDSDAHITEDGRLNISIDLKHKLPDLSRDIGPEIEEFAVDKSVPLGVPPLNIVIMIVGSRGDVQPFLALGNRLLKYKHRVRIATHETFRTFVQENGLEFFPIGGDPRELMSYMVRNPGLMPGFESLTNGDIPRKKKMIAEILDGCWRACFEPDKGDGRRFAADAIIANPPSFAHVHCAEALGIPVQLSFTMPWCPTSAFPHPLVNIKQTNAEPNLTNYLSYAIADLMTWQGLGDVVNKFRTKTLDLEPLSLRSGPSVLDRLKIPWTYCMSPALIPKPSDWKSHVDVCGFYFMNLASNYRPPKELEDFLQAGPPPIYIGFGSVVVEDSAAMTRTIFSAVQKSGTRALVSAGWGGLGGTTVPASVYILGNVPHDWLFPRCAAVCHHGGAGTTAIGLYSGKPTTVVPFFGDQPFWGAMIERAGAGVCIPQKELNADNLGDAMKLLLTPEAQAAAQRMGEQIRSEDGVENGAESFHRHLPLLNMRCDLDSSRVAVWFWPEQCLRLSAFAAQTLADARLLKMDQLDPHRAKEYETVKEISDPVTGGVSAIFWTVTHWYGGIAQIFYSPRKGIIKTTTAIPKGIMSIITGVQEGLNNAPKLYGSDVRQSGRVTSFSSGIKEGGKGLFYGYYDGITGLVREPYEGGKKEGLKGAVKGSLRSFANVTMRPAAGIVGTVAHPATGAWKSLQSLWAREQVHKQQATRLADGMDETRRSTRQEREAIIAALNTARATLPERRERYIDTAVAALQDPESFTTLPGDTSEQRREPPPLPPRGSSVAPSSQREIADEPDADAQFQTDLDMAMRLSLEDQ